MYSYGFINSRAADFGSMLAVLDPDAIIILDPALARRAADLLAARPDLAEIRHAAHEKIHSRYDLKIICLPKQIEFYSSLRSCY